MLTVRRWDHVEHFLATASGFLVAREAEHNLLLGLASTIARHPANYRLPPVFQTVHGPDDRVVAATLRTPPQALILSELADPQALDALLDASQADALPGVLGPAIAAQMFAERWAQRTGKRATREAHQRIFRLDHVIAPRPSPGTWREAAERDRELLGAWWAAFSTDVGVPIHDDPANIADRWLRRAGRTIYLWEDGGEVVSLAGVGGDTPNGARIGPVYTPNAQRGRGYASNLVAALSAHALATGKRFCFLFTDLANPTSNHIYQTIGYTAVADVDQYRFQSP